MCVHMYVCLTCVLGLTVNTHTTENKLHINIELVETHCLLIKLQQYNTYIMYLLMCPITSMPVTEEHIEEYIFVNS